MSEQVSNNDILQAVLELSQNQTQMFKRMDKFAEEQNKMSKRMDKLAEEQDNLSQQLADTEQRLTEKIEVIDEKIEVIASRQLATEADVRLLKKSK